RARGITTTIEDLLDILVDYEADLKHQTPPPEPPVPTVYYTHQQRGRFSGRGVRSSHIRSGGNTFNRGGGAFGNSKRGAATHHRHFAAGRNINSSSINKIEYGPQAHNVLICQFCDKSGHSARQCYLLQKQANQSQAQINYTAQPSSSSTTDTSPWLMDSAASHHVTADLGNLSIYSDYNGPDEILIGDGSGSQDRGATSARQEQR
ncbi:Retrovirus-related Pol polyprotein from transposon RE2, partial [Linum perenne]